MAADEGDDPGGRTSTVMVMPATLGTRRVGQDPASTTAGGDRPHGWWKLTARSGAVGPPSRLRCITAAPSAVVTGDGPGVDPRGQLAVRAAPTRNCRCSNVCSTRDDGGGRHRGPGGHPRRAPTGRRPGSDRRHPGSQQRPAGAAGRAGPAGRPWSGPAARGDRRDRAGDTDVRRRRCRPARPPRPACRGRGARRARVVAAGGRPGVRPRRAARARPSAGVRGVPRGRHRPVEGAGVRRPSGRADAGADRDGLRGPAAGGRPSDSRSARRPTAPPRGSDRSAALRAPLPQGTARPDGVRLARRERHRRALRPRPVPRAGPGRGRADRPARPRRPARRAPLHSRPDPRRHPGRATRRHPAPPRPRPDHHPPPHAPLRQRRPVTADRSDEDDLAVRHDRAADKTAADEAATRAACACSRHAPQTQAPRAVLRPTVARTRAEPKTAAPSP